MNNHLRKRILIRRQPPNFTDKLYAYFIMFYILTQLFMLYNIYVYINMYMYKYVYRYYTPRWR